MLELLKLICDELEVPFTPEFMPPRVGDVLQFLYPGDFGEFHL